MDIFVLEEMWGPCSSVEVMSVNVQLSVKHNGHDVDSYLERSRPSG